MSCLPFFSLSLFLSLISYFMCVLNALLIDNQKGHNVQITKCLTKMFRDPDNVHQSGFNRYLNGAVSS
jgi:hypothetical protein